MIPIRSLVWAVAAAWLVSLAGPSPVYADVDVSILPAPAVVDTSEVFDLELTIPVSGSEFNGFTTSVTYDTALVSFVSMSLPGQVGSLFTDACPGPPNPWHLFSASPGTLSVEYSMFCSGVFVTGPGVIYKLRFQARTQFGVTNVVFESVRFARAGVWVLPVTANSGTVIIGSATGLPRPGPGASLSLSAPRPNPARGPVTLSVDREEAGPTRVDVFAVNGALVRTLLRDNLSAGTHPIVWDGRDERGEATRPGIYLIRAAGPRAVVSRRLVKLD